MLEKKELSRDRFEVIEQVCANTPDGHHYLLVQAKDRQTGNIVWAVGDDHVCAITRADFIRNREVEYNDVLIQEFPYCDNTPESVGEWQPLIKELVEFTLQKYMEYDDLVHVYPQWLPDDLQMPFNREKLSNDDRVDHVILHEAGIMEVIFRPDSEAPRSQ